MHKLIISLIFTSICYNIAKADLYIGVQGGGSVNSSKTTLILNNSLIKNKVDERSERNKMAGAFLGYDFIFSSGLYWAVEANILFYKMDHTVVLDSTVPITVNLKNDVLFGNSIQIGYAFKNNIIPFFTFGSFFSNYAWQLSGLKRGPLYNKESNMPVLALGFGVKYKIKPWLVNLKYNCLSRALKLEGWHRSLWDMDGYNFDSYKLAEHVITIGIGYSF